MWVLESEPRSFTKATSALTAEPSHQPKLKARFNILCDMLPPSLWGWLRTTITYLTFASHHEA